MEKHLNKVLICVRVRALILSFLLVETETETETGIVHVRIQENSSIGQ